MGKILRLGYWKCSKTGERKEWVKAKEIEYPKSKRMTSMILRNLDNKEK